MPDPGTVHRGGCLCGAVRYEIRGGVGRACHCHCTMCQRAAGAPMVTWMTLPTASLVWTGASPRIHQSSAIAERGFCATCGSPLIFQYKARPDEIDVTAASLDDPEVVTPTYHLWVERRVSWLRIADGLPTFARSSESTQ